MNPTITPQLTPEQIEALSLNGGAHESAQDGHCLLEVVSIFAGESFSDEPTCVDPVLIKFGQSWNDGLPNDGARAQLKRYIPMLPGTAQGEALSLRRSCMAFDWLVSTSLPAWLDLSPALAKHAAALRALAPIAGEHDLDCARQAIDCAERSAVAAWAAGDAAWAAAWAAARAAAWDAARVAAQKGQIESGAPYGAFRQVMDEALAPTVLQLQASAHDLYTAMINAGERQ